jgi:hypothetical protein
MNLRQVAVLLGATASVVGEVRRALIGLDRSRRPSASGSAGVVMLVGAGVAIGAIAARPELRRRIGHWLLGEQVSPETVTAPASTPATAPREEVSAQAHTNGAP